MKNRFGQVAGLKALITVTDFTKISETLIQRELALNTRGLDNLALHYCTLQKANKKKSLIFRALKKSLRLTEENYELDRENTEDIISEALYLLKEASIKYFEKDRDCNFEQFAVVHIREKIKNYKSKWNNLNGSDRNELIHSAIRAIKNKNCQSGKKLNYDEAKHLAKHFNLCSINGYKIIWELESQHFEKKVDWVTVNNEEGKDEMHVTEIFKKGNSIPNINLSNYIKSFHNTPEIRSAGEKLFIKDEKENIKKIIHKFKLIYVNNNIKSLIFDNRIYCESEKELKLKELSKILRISIQRISFIEKNLKKNFKNFFNVEKIKSEDIK